MMLTLLDILLFIIHILIISFNLFGWIWKKTRKAHLWVAFITLGSWLILGLKYGLGYCFLTDWHWNIKRKLGETDLPNSFIQYLFDKVGWGIHPITTDYITTVALLIAIGMSVYLNFIRKSHLPK